jgi:hypothetical protein
MTRTTRTIPILVAAMAVLSLAFGLWYSLGALHAVPYVF